MTVLDATIIDEPTNADEALAYFLAYAADEDVVSMHTDFCRTHLGGEWQCTCTPRILKLGAKA